MRIDFIFAVWPYLAAAVLVGGLAARYAISRRHAEAAASALLDGREIFGGGGASGRAWRWSLLLLGLAHLTGLVLPRVILQWNGSPVRLYLLEGAGFLLGLVAVVGWVGVLWRHLGRNRSSVLGELFDSIFLALMLVGLVTGLLMAARYRWASTWGAVTLTPYVTSVVQGDPITTLAAEMPFLVQLHVFAAFALLAALPFTRVAPFLIAGIDRALALVTRPVAAANQGAEAWLRKHNPAVWIWPEED